MCELNHAGDTYEKLLGEVENLGALDETRSVEDLIKESADFEREDGALLSEHEQIGNTLEKLISKYAERSSLLDLLVDAREKNRRTQQELEACAKLPDGYDNWDGFINQYNRRAKKRETLRDDIHRNEKSRVELEAKMPEESAEETSAEWEDAKRHFDTTVSTAEAMDRVMMVTESLLEGQETDHTQQLKTAFETYLKKLTADRYSKGEFHQYLPNGVAGAQGLVYPFELLSAGTKDSFALALRLALAELFLRDTSGFVVLDDPFVDMDPGRRKAAAEVLMEYAGGTQLMVFTCHPSHAELFPKESKIDLEYL